MELDDLKRRWEDHDKKLDSSIRLNTRLLRETILARAETVLRRLSRLLWFEVLMNSVAVLLLGSFLGDHVSEGRFLIPALGLHLCAIALVVVGVRQLLAIKTLDYSAPIVVIQRRLESLRIERIRVTKLTLLFSPLIWTPLLIVTLKGLFGVDAYETLGATFLIANLLAGIVVIILAVWISRRFAARIEQSSLVQRMMRDLAGKSLTTAKGFLSSISEFEEHAGSS